MNFKKNLFLFQIVCENAICACAYKSILNFVSYFVNYILIFTLIIIILANVCKTKMCPNEKIFWIRQWI